MNPSALEQLKKKLQEAPCASAENIFWMSEVLDAPTFADLRPLQRFSKSLLAHYSPENVENSLLKPYQVVEGLAAAYNFTRENETWNGALSKRLGWLTAEGDIVLSFYKIHVISRRWRCAEISGRYWQALDALRGKWIHESDPLNPQKLDLLNNPRMATETVMKKSVDLLATQSASFELREALSTAYGRWVVERAEAEEAETTTPLDVPVVLRKFYKDQEDSARHYDESPVGEAYFLTKAVDLDITWGRPQTVALRLELNKISSRLKIDLDRPVGAVNYWREVLPKWLERENDGQLRRKIKQVCELVENPVYRG